MNDERILILQMLEKGKISVEEAAALLEALDPASTSQDTPEPTSAEEPKSDDTSHADTTDGGGDGDRDRHRDRDRDRVRNRERDRDRDGHEDADEDVNEDGDTQSRIDDRLRQLRETIRQKAPGPDEINSFVRTVQKGIAQVIDEIPDVMNRLLHWEFRSGVAGHTFEEDFSGTFSAHDEVVIRIHSEDGPIRVFPSDDGSYHVRVVNRVRVDDEVQAKRLSQEITQWKATDTGFELTVRNHSRVSSQVQVALPLGFPYDAKISSGDGSVVWERVNGASLYLSTDDGAIKVTEAAARSIQVHTSDGGVLLREVEADSVDARSSDGSVRFDGFARVLRCKTSDGAVRATLLPKGPEGPVADELSWELISSDGSIAADVPATDDYGYRLNLSTSDGGIAVYLPGITSTTSGTGVFNGETSGFDSKPVRATLSIRTSDGSIRVGATE